MIAGTNGKPITRKRSEKPSKRSSAWVGLLSFAISTVTVLGGTTLFLTFLRYAWRVSGIWVAYLPGM